MLPQGLAHNSATQMLATNRIIFITVFAVSGQFPSELPSDETTLRNLHRAPNHVTREKVSVIQTPHSCLWYF